LLRREGSPLRPKPSPLARQTGYKEKFQRAEQLFCQIAYFDNYLRVE